ncbi:MAG TPA: hypothetical protein VJ032_07555 [Thermoanaerobaculia bacterium]|nr:hypothetical protein [Thermoanaerobaculia bacterium]
MKTTSAPQRRASRSSGSAIQWLPVGVSMKSELRVICSVESTIAATILRARRWRRIDSSDKPRESTQSASCVVPLTGNADPEETTTTSVMPRS